MAGFHSNDCRYGYLLVVEDENNSFTGGYLIVNDRGRPLEFHCTETVHPSRAQEILFGPTLRSYLFSEHLGTALIEAAALSINVLIVNDLDAVGAGEGKQIPTVCLEESCEAIDENLKHLAESIDLNEPFGRVREAVLEACRFHGGDASNAAA